MNHRSHSQNSQYSHRLAQYRLELDLQKSAGTFNTQSTPGLTEALYKEKYQELVSALNVTNKRAFLIDTQTGKATEQTELAKLTQGLRHILFISENEFVFLESIVAIHTLGRHNLTTHLETPILSDLSFYSVQISPDLSNLFLRISNGWGNANPGVKT